ncbi:hypothetical protein BYT27DRAFT_7284261 [Phlegmacium glaucopus]|nr:hypothetical protein BYT27DRAFT_7284261 [Phlegmacium glaucopus]
MLQGYAARLCCKAMLRGYAAKLCYESITLRGYAMSPFHYWSSCFYRAPKPMLENVYKTPTIQVPAVPDYISPFLSHSATTSENLGASPLDTSSPDDLLAFSPTPSLSPLGSPFNMHFNLSESSSQPRLIQPPQNTTKKLEVKFKRMEKILGDWGFDSIGDFSEIMFYNPVGKEDPRSVAHGLAVARFLQGKTKTKMSDIILLIYSHKHSAPSPKSTWYHERHAPFSPSVSPAEIHHARPSLFTWATNLVAKHAHHEIYKLTVKDNNTHLLSIASLCEKYRTRAPVSWYLTESMAGLCKNGVFIIQVGAVSSFIFSRNRYANGDLAMALGIWHFAVKSHIDVKRVYSRFGNIALDSMTGSSLTALQNSVKDATRRGETEWCLSTPVYEGGIARQSILKVGTAGTAIRLDDCEPGAFDLQSHLTRVAQKKRKTMTVETLRTDIDWTHLLEIQSLHWARVLVDYIPELNSMSKDISKKFRSEPLAKHRMREGRKTVVQPLGTNSERETETQGMARAIMDFDEQMGLGSEEADQLLSWVRGDGASYATTLRLQKYLCSIPDNHKSFRNRIATPEIWHAKATMINSITANHYGPPTSKDPSSLSRSSNAAGFKRPSNLNSCDYYPTVRSMTLVWEARVLDCWRVFLEAKPDLLSHFANLARQDELPSLEILLLQASILVNRYASQDAHEQALSHAESSDAPAPMKVMFGLPFIMQNTGSTPSTQLDISESDPPALLTEDLPKVHQEADNFDGDRVLANSILFLQDFGWWIEVAFAIPEGNIGRVFEILKLWIFTFAGSSQQNYTTYLLEEASEDLRNGILNNWLVNITGELGRWIEADLLQEHYNRWLEDMVKKRGGDFDDNFYRHTLAPNVNHFLRIKEEIENAFALHSRGKTHTSPHLRDELRVLFALYKEENLHFFCAGRTLGHAATNQLRSTAYADVIVDIQAHRQAEAGPDTELQAQSFQFHAETDNAIVNIPLRLSETGSSSSLCTSKSDSVRSPTPSHVSSSTQSEDDEPNEDDPSNNQLVSGSDYDIYLSDDQLMHQAWHEQEYREDRDSSSDEDDGAHNIDHGISSDSDNGVEDNDLYNSD